MRSLLMLACAVSLIGCSDDLEEQQSNGPQQDNRLGGPPIVRQTDLIREGIKFDFHLVEINRYGRDGNNLIFSDRKLRQIVFYNIDDNTYRVWNYRSEGHRHIDVDKIKSCVGCRLAIIQFTLHSGTHIISIVDSEGEIDSLYRQMNGVLDVTLNADEVYLWRGTDQLSDYNVGKLSSLTKDPLPLASVMLGYLTKLTPDYRELKLSGRNSSGFEGEIWSVGVFFEQSPFKDKLVLRSISSLKISSDNGNYEVIGDENRQVNLSLYNLEHGSVGQSECARDEELVVRGADYKLGAFILGDWQDNFFRCFETADGTHIEPVPIRNALGFVGSDEHLFSYQFDVYGSEVLQVFRTGSGTYGLKRCSIGHETDCDVQFGTKTH